MTPNSRSYLNHFTQPDSIVPDPYNSQDYDRYSYVRNNPLKYTDPTGHVCREDGKGCESGGGTTSKDYSASWLRSFLKDRYGWNVASDFTEDELKVIRQTANDIESYVGGLTGGAGLEWMLGYLRNTIIVHGNWSDGHGEAWPRLFGATIKLGESWLTGAWRPMETLTHEFGHVLDINSGNFLGLGGGPADQLSIDLGGIPQLSVCRFCTGKRDPHNPPGLWTIHGGYGNESINDYFAEGFASSVLGAPMPPGVNDWIVGLITNQASLIH